MIMILENKMESEAKRTFRPRTWWSNKDWKTKYRLQIQSLFVQFYIEINQIRKKYFIMCDKNCTTRILFPINSVYLNNDNITISIKITLVKNYLDDWSVGLSRAHSN